MNYYIPSNPVTGAKLSTTGFFEDTVNGSIVPQGDVWNPNIAYPSRALAVGPDGLLYIATNANVNSAPPSNSWKSVGSQFADEISGNTGAQMVGFIQEGQGAAPREELSKTREHVTPEDFGAVGDGQADDSSAFQRAESSQHPVIELTRGHTYIVNGVQLKKRYVGFGTLLLDGVPHRVDPIFSAPFRARTPYWIEDFPTLGGNPNWVPARSGHSAQRPMYSVEDVTVWVDPVSGDDARDGKTQQTALRTFAAAMSRVPYYLFHAARIYLLDGVYDEAPIVSHVFSTASRWANFAVIGHTPNNPAYSDTKPEAVVFSTLASDGSRAVTAWSCIYGGTYNTSMEGVTIDAFWPYDVTCRLMNCIIQRGGGAFNNYAIGGHGGRVGFFNVTFKDIPAQGLIVEAVDFAHYIFDTCTFENVLAPFASVKNCSHVALKSCSIDLSTSFCEAGSMLMGDMSMRQNQFGIGLDKNTAGYVTLAGGTPGSDFYNEGGQVITYGKDAAGSNGGAVVVYFGSRLVTNTSSKFVVAYSDATGSREVFRVKPLGVALPSLGYQLNAVAASTTSGFTNMLFVDAADNKLKFRDSTNAIKVVTLT
ncbi:hypothetical protein [Caballeronia insecticola]|nr:hypothetical protein [Caballeronia insecticola]